MLQLSQSKRLEPDVSQAYIDKETVYQIDEEGEIVGQSTSMSVRQVKFEQEPDYVKLYIQTISVFMDIKETAGKVFYEMVKLMAYAEYEQLVYLNPALRKRIQKNLEISQSTFDKSLRQLRDAKLISKIANNTFAVNPIYVGKGKWRDIKRLQAKFDFITGDVITDFGYDDE